MHSIMDVLASTPAPDFDPTASITTAVGKLTSELTDTAPIALGVGASVLALTFAWKLVRKFAKG